MFYDESGKIQVESDINKNMAQDTLDQCSKYYNKADEYIGCLLYTSDAADDEHLV